LTQNTIARLIKVDIGYIAYIIWILLLDALVVIPISKRRIKQRPIRFAFIEILNTLINLGLNIFVLDFLPKLAHQNPDSVFSLIYVEDFQVGYIFVSNLIASLLTFLYFLPDYIKLNCAFDSESWKRMMKYSLPVLVAGIA